eukprot:1628517-Rhodomonas_salina.4
MHGITQTRDQTTLSSHMPTRARVGGAGGAEACVEGGGNRGGCCGHVEVPWLQTSSTKVNRGRCCSTDDVDLRERVFC